MKDVLKNWQKNDLYLAASIFYFIGAVVEIVLAAFIRASIITSVLAILAIFIGLAFTVISVVSDGAE